MAICEPVRINKDQILTDEMAGLLTPSRPCRFILLACGSRVFFFESSPEPFWHD